MSLQPRITRLRRTLSCAERLLLHAADETIESSLSNSTRRTEILTCLRRLGFLVSAVEREMHAADMDTCRDETVVELLHSAKTFLSSVLHKYGPRCGVPSSCVGLLGSMYSPRRPFHSAEPLLVHEDPNLSTESACIFTCTYHRDEEEFCRRAAAPSVRAADAPPPLQPPTEDAVQTQVMEDIRAAIRGMKEGVIRMSDMMQQERVRLDANAELLQRGVDGTSTQSRRIDELGYAFGGGPSLPRCMSSVPGAKIFWQTIVVPMWAVIRQAVFMCIILGVTCGLLLLMMTAPKTYVYVR